MAVKNVRLANNTGELKNILFGHAIAIYSMIELNNNDLVSD